MSDQKQSPLDGLLATLEAIAVKELGDLIGKGVAALFHKHKAKVADAAIPVVAVEAIGKTPTCSQGYHWDESLKRCIADVG